MEGFLSGGNKLESPPGGQLDHLKINNEEKEMQTYSYAPGLCNQMCLLEYSDHFIIEPTDEKVRQYLSLDRIDGKLELFNEMPQFSGQQLLRTSTIYGVIGVIKLLAGFYVLVITGREHAGSYNGSPVYLISSMKFLDCNSGLGSLTTQERKDEAHFVSLLKMMEKIPGLFFSYEADLTLSLQRANCYVGARKSQPLWKQADPRFLWNHYILEDLIECKLEPYILPVVQGSFQEIVVPVKEADLNITLVARRCNRRLGTRMWRRGADLEGHTANFVETEQILKTSNHVASYVQVRGSIPLLWEQIVDLTYKPQPKLINAEQTPKVVDRHFHDLVQRYGSVLVVDLVNQQGSEEILSLAYGSAMQNIADQNIRYVPFDFHRICGHVHLERLSLLYEQIKGECNWQGFFLVKPDGDIEKQKGVVRVNCVDCLDRTNITQSLLGRKAMERILQRMGVFDERETISDHDSFDQHFKMLWATHGDDISIQYSGTQALKGDFVRHGKRTIIGILQDGFNALARYYLNNFHDGSKQDALDLISGHYIVSRHKPSPFQLNGFEAFAYLPLASALIVTGLTLTTSSIWRVGQDAFYFIYSVLWAGFTAGITAAVKAHGRQFCSRPRLCKLL